MNNGEKHDSRNGTGIQRRSLDLRIQILRISAM